MLLAVLASCAAGSGGSAFAQTFGPDPLADMRLRMEQQRLESDLRSQQATQFRFDSELSSLRLQNAVRNPLGERLSTLQPADAYADAARADQARRRAEAERARRVQQQLRDIEQ